MKKKIFSFFLEKRKLLKKDFKRRPPEFVTVESITFNKLPCNSPLKVDVNSRDFLEVASILITVSEKK